MLCSIKLSPGIDINVSKEDKGNKHTNIKPPPYAVGFNSSQML